VPAIHGHVFGVRVAAATSAAFTIDRPKQLPRQNHMTIAVTFALPTESADFLRCLTNKTRVERNGVGIIRGEIDHRKIEVLHTGVGEKVCQQRLGKFLNDQDFACSISTGFAGALNDDLQVGDLLLAENFSTVDLSEARASLSGLPIHIANLLTVPALIDSPEERNKLALTSGALAVDMETRFIARTCAARGVPLLSLRVISDTPRELFPASADVLFDIERQRTSMSKLAKYFLAHPSRIPHLIRFARRIALARKILADALVAVATAL
jgi:adenosylhomocysteine nucleosidase